MSGEQQPVRHSTGAARRGRWLTFTLYTLVVLLLATAGGGFVLYTRLNANISSSELYTGTTGSAGVQQADDQGRFPVNVLVIGTDSRSSKANCKLGGACDETHSNADVELLVHVSADRTNITAMSIPRDTMTDLPGCDDPATGESVGERYGQINTSLNYGPGCQVAAVHQLTGITIDHFVLVDFAGVIAMSDATGGVEVCVDNNVYDTYSHLKLSKGKHTLKGEAALQFVRTRHGFGDGSDLGRTYGQHAFLSAAIRALKDRGTLLNPTKLYGVANAATKALTVDEKLSGIPDLVELAGEFNKVDTDRITFTTMQTVPDPENPNRVVPADAAQKLFDTIIADRSLSKDKTAATSTATSSASPTPQATTSTFFSVQVRNRSGQDGRAKRLTRALKTEGYIAATDSSSGDDQATSAILYNGSRQLAQAEQLAADLNMPSSLLATDEEVDAVTLVVGEDWTKGTTYPKITKAQREEALSDAHASSADKSGCVPVSTQNTVTYQGVSMSPVRAYELATDVPDSDA
ncbi:transcriptional regulator [Kineosporia sp. NBRC 101677]|uniref:LCP family protein n=1 Tax=Kineosporia sp. NBRC 101677 TaxID=3032197 RepID=UPI0024A36FBC|nr:LCP family protein [Kineosporia sp. NBRC 101677]GLY18332.1 transcriptional regulator [Kineosporia sp. NBRC 101677]